MDEIKKLKALFSREEPIPKFGAPSGEEAEMKCKDIHVYMIAARGLSDFIGIDGERRRKVMNPAATIKDARSQFGKELLVQDLVKDENSYIINEADLDKPLYKFSNKCQLALTFVHSDRIRHI